MYFEFGWVSDPASWIALITLIALELVLGVDNIIFISILSGKLPKEDQPRARTTGIMLAVITRILLLLSLSWIISLEEPFFYIPWFGEHDSIGISGRDLILIVGGLFLLWKSTHEIHEKLEGKEGAASAKVAANFASVIIQIMLLDIVFSLDSVITAVGMVDHITIMVIAVIIAASIMIFVAAPIGEFVERHPTIKILALSFLLLIGFTLVVEGLHQHIPKGYVYFAMGFSVMVEMLNLRVRNPHVKPVNLRDAYKEAKPELQPVMAAGASAPAVVSGKAKPKPKSGKKKK
ncbi:MAG: TerC family protein [Anaerolineales bacterium]|uniref:TerC family protein n=1 Tax=Candidatus Villigracilis vicinus TaxID=3140679 RepID=UPI003136E7FD|nr:TerC family protein [Anaerolineales bacterium]